jgi:hypothetical protein
MNLLILVALVALAAVLVRGRYRPRRERCPREAPAWHCRCPGCGHKLRYRRRPAGQRVFCPRCLHVFVFPRALPGRSQPSSRPGPSPSTGGTPAEQLARGLAGR